MQRNTRPWSIAFDRKLQLNALEGKGSVELMSQCKIALVALIALAAWLFVALPIIYLPGSGELLKEPLGIKLGEWLLAIATFGLWSATWRLVRGADRTAERQLRAYVGAFDFSFSYSGAGSFSVTVKVKNFGDTPAANFRTSFRLNYVPAPVSTVPLHEPDWVSAGVSLLPGEESITICELNVGPGSLPSVVSGQFAICLSGYIDYRDAFGHDRRTIIRRIATGPRVQSVSPFIHAPEGDGIE
jgi:hypothetical protein